jgi:hypothetical protein
MKPTVLKNPGVAVYRAGGRKDARRQLRSQAGGCRAAAIAAADKENRKLGLAANASAAPKSADGRVVDGPATPKQTVARLQKRHDAPPRVAQREAPPSLFGFRFGGLF